MPDLPDEMTNEQLTAIRARLDEPPPVIARSPVEITGSLHSWNTWPCFERTASRSKRSTVSEPNFKVELLQSWADQNISESGRHRCVRPTPSR